MDNFVLNSESIYYTTLTNTQGNGNIASRANMVLKRLPALKSFQISGSIVKIFWDEYDNEPVESPAPCIVSHLKHVKFIDFMGRRGQIYLAKLFLKNADMLEKMLVHGEKPYMPENAINFILSNVRNM